MYLPDDNPNKAMFQVVGQVYGKMNNWSEPQVHEV